MRSSGTPSRRLRPAARLRAPLGGVALRGWIALAVVRLAGEGKTRFVGLGEARLEAVAPTRLVLLDLIPGSLPFYLGHRLPPPLAFRPRLSPSKLVM